MEEDEFYHHITIIRNLLRREKLRIVLLHNPYTDPQQEMIDKLCIHCPQIIGQVLRIEPMMEAVNEVDTLLANYNDPHIPEKNLQFVILGQQKPNF